MASTDEKKRTQEASETDFTTRGGRQDATSGTGKPHTSPCKRAPEMPDEAGTVNDRDPDPEEEEYWRHETKHSIS